MADRSSPLCNRGSEALQDLLAGDTAAAEQQLRLLSRSELGRLSTVARMLSVQAMRIAVSTPAE